MANRCIRIAQIRAIRAPKHCEEICAPAPSKWVIIVSIPIAIGEEEGSQNTCFKSCWRGHKSFIFQRLIDELMCFCYECLSAACLQMCSCWAFQSRKKPEHSAVNRRVVGSSPTPRALPDPAWARSAPAAVIGHASAPADGRFAIRR